MADDQDNKNEKPKKPRAARPRKKVQVQEPENLVPEAPVSEEMELPEGTGEGLSDEQTAAILRLLSRARTGKRGAKSGEDAPEDDAPEIPVIPEIIPILPLKDTVVFPMTVFPAGSRAGTLD